MHGKLNKCRFCRTDPTEDRVQTIHYSNVDLIRQYINARGMILPSRVTGLCARHQRRIRYAIKNARFLALLSYTSDWHVPYSYVNPAQYPAHKDQQLARDHDVAERIERKQADLELLASARSTEDRQQITEAILARKGIVPGVDLSKEQRLVHLQALPNKLSGPFVDRFAPPNARAPVPDSEMATIGEILAAHPNAAMQHAAALLEEEADEAAELAAAPGFWSSEAELDAAGDSVFHAIANAGESAGYASEGELEYLREAAATEQDEARAAGFREFLTAQLQVRLAQTLNAEEAAEIREELRQLGCTDADAIRDGLGTVPRVRSNEDELAGRATGAGAVLRASAAPTAEQVLRDLGVDVGALAARDEGFDAVAWVEKIRQIQAANKLRNTQNPFDEGDRVEDLKALHRLGFTGTAEKQ
jgi:small subunit ribosomal protein S18